MPCTSCSVQVTLRKLHCEFLYTIVFGASCSKVARAGADPTQGHLGNALGREAGNEAVAQVAHTADVDVAHRVVARPRKDREEVEVLRGSLHGVVRVLQAALCASCSAQVALCASCSAQVALRKLPAQWPYASCSAPVAQRTLLCASVFARALCASCSCKFRASAIFGWNALRVLLLHLGVARLCSSSSAQVCSLCTWLRATDSAQLSLYKGLYASLSAQVGLRRWLCAT